MTAQHVPHTPPRRRFLSLPHTPLGWLAIGLSGTFWVLQATFQSVAAPVMESLSGVEQWLIIWALVLPGVAGTVVASFALLRSLERSALVWLAMVAGLPAFLGAGWNMLVFAGMNWLGEIGTLLVMAALVVLISVLIAWLGLHRWFVMVPVLTFVLLGIFGVPMGWVFFGLWLAVASVLFLLSLVIYDTVSGWLKMRSGKPG